MRLQRNTFGCLSKFRSNAARLDGFELTKVKIVIQVIYWVGTTQKTKTVTSYAAAQKLVAKEHRNARDPRFETEDGETLVDTGEFFVTESEAAKSNPVVYA